jgi:hypothetical protein
MIEQETVVGEFEGAEFGDARLSRRLSRLLPQLASRPSDSFPEATTTDSDLEATYRFFGNERVTPERILAPHVEATLKRAAGVTRLIVAHDTTEMIFAGKSRREELGWSKRDNVGFLAHASLAVSRESSSMPLGVLSMQPFFRTKPARGPNPNRNKKSLEETEFDRWWQAAEQTDTLFPEERRPIHVMDREADDYGLFADLLSQKMRFVVRVRHNRARCKNVDASKDEVAGLREILAGLRVKTTREVQLSKRSKPSFPDRRRGKLPRDTRTATLDIAAARISLARPQFALSAHPARIEVSAVYVSEKDAPEGTEPVEWMLFSSEPIRTEDDILNIVDDYRARWRIEEFFKALKTGCAYEKRQLESRHALLNVLAVFTPIAWQLLALRTRSRWDDDVPAETILTTSQIDVLVATASKSVDRDLSAKQALLLVAALGGHITNNGPPGWIVLSRGMDNLLMMELGWNAARGKM